MKLKKLFEKCYKCSGYGFHFGESGLPKQTCARCGGKGFVFKENAVAKIREELNCK